MGISQEARQLKSAMERLLAKPQSDAALFKQLQSFQTERPLRGLTWYWGPELYRRNRLQFLPFIMAHFSQFDPEGDANDNLITWETHASRLESWLRDVHKNRDSWLEQKLTRWKFSIAPFGIDEVRFCEELVRQYREANKKSARAQVLDAFDSRFQLTEPVALALYQIDNSCSAFLQKHLLRGTLVWRDEPRQLWQSLFEAALGANDEDLAFQLYRWQAPQEEWQKDLERLTTNIEDTGKLNEELHKRSPIGIRIDWHEPVLTLLKNRGRDVFPFVRGCLSSLSADQSDPILELALTSGWWDLWAGILHAHGDAKWLNQKIIDLLDRTDRSDKDRRDGLAELAAPTIDAPDLPFWLWRTPYLEDATAVRLYRHDPQWLKIHFTSAIINVYDPPYSQLLATALAHEDHELVDLIASGYVRVNIYHDYSTPQHDAKKKAIETLHPIYQALREHDETGFARRVSNLLSRLPQKSLEPFSMLLARNALARLFFDESIESFLSAPDAVALLIEANQLEVQILGFRVLGIDDSRARWLAVLSLDILLGALRRPLSRRGKKIACLALANAARGDATAAERILKRARESLAGRDKNEWKEPLIGLVGKILFHQPDLRSPNEQPIVYLPRGARR